MSDIDFLIIGAAKSATTWLQKQLQQDPSIAMPDPELHYFSREYQRGDAWYLAQFPERGVQAITGEKSNSYLETEGVAARIHKSIPQVKLIAQLRNPVDRAYSDYCMLYRRGEVGKDIDSYLDPRVAAGSRFLAGGHYSRHLEAYLRLFKRESLMIVAYEEVMRDPERNLTDIKAFLDCTAPSAAGHAKEGKVKDRSTPMLAPALRRRLKWLKPMVATIRHTHLFRHLHSRLAIQIQYPEFHPELRARLVNYYAAEVDELQRLTGKQMLDWQPSGAPRELGGCKQKNDSLPDI